MHSKDWRWDGKSKTAIRIIDGMTFAFRSMTNAMNIVINSFEHLQNASHNSIKLM